MAQRNADTHATTQAALRTSSIIGAITGTVLGGLVGLLAGLDVMPVLTGMVMASLTTAALGVIGIMVAGAVAGGLLGGVIGALASLVVVTEAVKKEAGVADESLPATPVIRKPRAYLARHQTVFGEQIGQNYYDEDEL